MLVPLTVAPWVLGYAGAICGSASVVLGAVFLAGAFKVWRDKTDSAAKGLFAYSILYLFLLFALLMADALILGMGGTA
jgi:protoheme IX farnesyltransferase